MLTLKSASLKRFRELPQNANGTVFTVPLESGVALKLLLLELDAIA